MRIVHRLFVVLLAENDHGKSNLVQSLVAQGLGLSPGRLQKQRRLLTSPWGRPIDSYIYVRSYQEAEKGHWRTVRRALDENDPAWFERELILMPSHAERNDARQMLRAANEAGFDTVCATVIVDDSDPSVCAPIWSLAWDQRWTIPNPRSEDWRGQVDALGRDFWTWICGALNR
jgi:hypothetical protein